jgi:hypothetical protein
VPKILERLVSQLEAKGMPKSNAYAVATHAQQAAGNLKPGTQELTPQGKHRQDLGAAGRAKRRAANHSGSHESMSKYVYNPRTNTAHLKKG